MDEMPDINLRAVIFREGGFWVAQAIETNICVSALSLDRCLKRLDLSIRAQLVVGRQFGQDGIGGIPAASAEFLAMFEAAIPVPLAGQRIEMPGAPCIHLKEIRLAA